MSWCHWQEKAWFTDPLASQRSKVLTKPLPGAYETTATKVYSVHAAWQAGVAGSYLHHLHETMDGFVRIQTLPCTSVVSGQAHVHSAFKGIHDRAASVSDERAFVSTMYLYTGCSTVLIPPLPRWKYTSAQGQSPVGEVIFISTGHAKHLIFEKQHIRPWRHDRCLGPANRRCPPGRFDSMNSTVTGVPCDELDELLIGFVQ